MNNTPSKLNLKLVSDTEISMERTFDAPRALVFRAFAEPDMISKWWGGSSPEATVKVDKMDFKPGGAWRYVESDGDGNEYAFHGEYRTIVPPETLAYTFEFEGMPGHVVVDTITFEDLGAKTRMLVRSTFDSKEDRDGMIQTGMEDGAALGYAKMDELLKTMKNEE